MRKTTGCFGAMLVLLSAGCSFPGVELGQLPETGGASGGTGTAASTIDVGTGASTTGTRGVAQVAVGWYHVCALLTDGSVECWGDNYGGMLGDGTDTNHLRPAPVLGLSGTPVRIDADYTDSCALYADGSSQCWGSNNYGQLGDGTTTERTLPVTSVIGPLSQFSLGEYSTCGLFSGGTVSCWGYNQDSVLGPSVATGGNSLTPVPISGIANATQVSAGAGLSCALLADKTVACWGGGGGAGANACDALNIIHSTPFTVDGVSDVIQISAGSGHVCALHSDGTLTCWGANEFGQVGPSGSTSAACLAAFESTPVPVPGLANVVEVAAGDAHSCALLSDGHVACWGANSGGQLGDGTTTQHANPTLALGVTNAVHISAGFAQTCAVISDGSLTCWGNFGSLVSVGPRPTPAQVTF